MSCVEKRRAFLEDLLSGVLIGEGGEAEKCSAEGLIVIELEAIGNMFRSQVNIDDMKGGKYSAE